LENFMAANEPGKRAGGNSAVLSDVATLRRRAREHIEEGAVTPSYPDDRKQIVQLLNEALATELVCVLRYKRHYFMAKGIHAEAVAAEFQEHAADEQQHADQIAERITQLGGAPDFSPEGLATRSHAEYVEGDSLEDMIREDLVAERIAIDSYREIINYVGDRDTTTKRMLEGICSEAIEILNDTPCPVATFDILRRMASIRQINAAELMMGQNNFTAVFAKAILAATPDAQLVDPRKKKLGGERAVTKGRSDIHKGLAIEAMHRQIDPEAPLGGVDKLLVEGNADVDDADTFAFAHDWRDAIHAE